MKPCTRPEVRQKRCSGLRNPRIGVGLPACSRPGCQLARTGLVNAFTLYLLPCPAAAEPDAGALPRGPAHSVRPEPRPALGDLRRLPALEPGAYRGALGSARGIG